MTSGGHIVAAREKLVAAGYEVADIAFVVGRTVYTGGDALGMAVESCPRSPPTIESPF